MPFRPRVVAEHLESRQLLSAAVGPSALSYSAGVTVAEIPTQTFNVKNYGAKGDGVSDDKASIQSAINAMTANGGGRSRNHARKWSISAGSPSTSTMAPEVSLRTDPDNPKAAAVV